MEAKTPVSSSASLSPAPYIQTFGKLLDFLQQKESLTLDQQEKFTETFDHYLSDLLALVPDAQQTDFFESFIQHTSSSSYLTNRLREAYKATYRSHWGAWTNITSIIDLGMDPTLQYPMVFTYIPKTLLEVMETNDWEQQVEKLISMNRMESFADIITLSINHCFNTSSNKDSKEQGHIKTFLSYVTKRIEPTKFIPFLHRIQTLVQLEYDTLDPQKKSAFRSYYATIMAEYESHSTLQDNALVIDQTKAPETKPTSQKTQKSSLFYSLLTEPGHGITNADFGTTFQLIECFQDNFDAFMALNTTSWEIVNKRLIEVLTQEQSNRATDPRVENSFDLAKNILLSLYDKITIHRATTKEEQTSKKAFKLCIEIILHSFGMYLSTSQNKKDFAQSLALLAPLEAIKHSTLLMPYLEEHNARPYVELKQAITELQQSLLPNAPKIPDSSIKSSLGILATFLKNNDISKLPLAMQYHCLDTLSHYSHYIPDITTLLQAQYKISPTISPTENLTYDASFARGHVWWSVMHPILCNTNRNHSPLFFQKKFLFFLFFS
jgi:hypothetical protein